MIRMNPGYSTNYLCYESENGGYKVIKWFQTGRILFEKQRVKLQLSVKSGKAEILPMAIKRGEIWTVNLDPTLNPWYRNL